MAYNVIDLIDKAIVIANKRKEHYENIEIKSDSNNRIKVFKNVFIKNIQKNIDYYEKLKLEVDDNNVEVINFAIYDKISFLINEFNERTVKPVISDVKMLIDFTLDYDKQILALFVDVQGRLLLKEEDIETTAYKLLSTVIKQKRKQIEDLENLVNNN